LLTCCGGGDGVKKQKITTIDCCDGLERKGKKRAEGSVLIDEKEIEGYVCDVSYYEMRLLAVADCQGPA